MPFHRGMTRENVTLTGDKGTPTSAYAARQAGSGLSPGVVLIHHLPGWSELYIETTHRSARHGYLAIRANLYERSGAGRGRHYRRRDGRRHRGRGRVNAGAAQAQRNGRPVRLLLRRPTRLPLCVPEEGRRRLRRTVGRPRRDGQGGAQRQDAGRTDRPDKGFRLPAHRPSSATKIAHQARSR